MINRFFRRMRDLLVLLRQMELARKDPRKLTVLPGGFIRLHTQALDHLGIGIGDVVVTSLVEPGLLKMESLSHWVEPALDLGVKSVRSEIRRRRRAELLKGCLTRAPHEGCPDEEERYTLLESGASYRLVPIVPRFDLLPIRFQVAGQGLSAETLDHLFASLEFEMLANNEDEFILLVLDAKGRIQAAPHVLWDGDDGFGWSGGPASPDFLEDIEGLLL